MSVDVTKVYKRDELLKLDPLDLLELLSKRLSINIPNQITVDNQVDVAKELSRAMQFEIYVSEMADRANIMKNKYKAIGEKEQASEMQLRENVLKGQASRLKKSYEVISRMFTIERQRLEELRLLGLTS